jgi:light-harvesting complex II chlorophyll a/b binding protein 5
MAGMAGCAAAVGQAEFLGQTLCNNHHRPTTTTAAGGALQVVCLVGKKKPAAAAKKAVQKAVAKVNKPTNEELAKWYGPDRRIYLPEGLLDKSDIPAYLTGEVPGE